MSFTGLRWSGLIGNSDSNIAKQLIIKGCNIVNLESHEGTFFTSRFKEVIFEDCNFSSLNLQCRENDIVKFQVVATDSFILKNCVFENIEAQFNTPFYSFYLY